MIRSISIEEAREEIEAAFQFEAPENEGGQLIHMMTTDISTLNTVLTSDTYSAWIAGFIYDFLIVASPVHGRERPLSLAKSWEIAKDGVTYTLTLHENIKWHDGEPFTADDVIFAYDRALADVSQSVRKSTIEGGLPRTRRLMITRSNSSPLSQLPSSLATRFNSWASCRSISGKGYHPLTGRPTRDRLGRIHPVSLEQGHSSSSSGCWGTM